MDSTDPNEMFELEQLHKGFWGSDFTVYLLTVLLGVMSLAVLDTILNRYYGLDSSIETIVPADEPADIFQLGCLKPVIGFHYFGDFQSEYCRMRGATPFSSDVASSYLPGFYVLVSFVSLFASVVSSWLAINILSVLFLVATIKNHLKGTRPVVASILLLAVFNPFWQTLDRGNFSLLLAIGFVLLSAKQESRTERGWLIAVAVTLKIQLAPFLLILLCGGSFRDKWRSLVHFVGIFVLLNFVFPLLGWRDFSQFYPNLFKSLQSATTPNRLLDYGIRTLTFTVAQLDWSIWFWVFFILFSMVFTMCLVYVNALDRFWERRDAKEELILAALFASSITILCSPLSYVYGLMVLLVPLVLIVSAQHKIRLIHKVQLVLITICALPNNVLLDSFINRLRHLPDENMVAYPSLGHLIPSVLLPSVAFSALIIGCIDVRRHGMARMRRM
jgi:hypothetical protein